MGNREEKSAMGVIRRYHGEMAGYGFASNPPYELLVLVERSY
jgi:hypothetical protein